MSESAEGLTKTNEEITALQDTSFRAADCVVLCPMTDGSFWLEFAVTGYLQRFVLTRQDVIDLRAICDGLLTSP